MVQKLYQAFEILFTQLCKHFVNNIESGDPSRIRNARRTIHTVRLRSVCEKFTASRRYRVNLVKQQLAAHDTQNVRY